MDRAGNESQTTTSLLVTIPSTLSKALNGEFDDGTQNWQLSTFAAGASATMSIDSSSVISGRNSCAVTISSVTGIDWNIALWQWLSIHLGHKYKITFKAKASTTKTITLGVQQAASPYTMYLGKAHTLTTAVQTFTDTVSIKVTDQAKVEFFLGTTTASVWIDSVSVIESSSATTGVVERGDEKPEAFALQQNYPNPFNPTTTIRYELPKATSVRLTVYDVLGREVSMLVNELKQPGRYEAVFDGKYLTSGVYLYRLQAGSFVQSRKFLLLK
jgi:hypothetical protein